jgi:hypothetical protein
MRPQIPGKPRADGLRPAAARLDWSAFDGTGARWRIRVALQKPAIASASRVCGIAAFILAACQGCVERTVSINSEPQGATVFLNDQEVGRTPVKVPFTWYGDYDIIIRKQGYETIKGHCSLNAPWYQYPFIDLFAECLIPMTLRDEHELDTFVMTPFEAPARQALLDRADDMRARAGEAGIVPQSPEYLPGEPE